MFYPPLILLVSVFSALESKLVSQFCEDENGALIYNHITNGHWNSHNGHGDNVGGYSGQNVNGNSGFIDKEEIQNWRRHNSRGRGDTFVLPINADPLPVQVSARKLEGQVNWLISIFHNVEK